ncbi:MAG: hypothetical protein RLZZ401_1279, partial [Pseudomonadota bacterium]
MRSAKTTRIWVATCVALCLLFAQMATAAYVCPHLLGSAVPTPGYMQAVATGCDAMHPSQMDNAQPNLCKAH